MKTWIILRIVFAFWTLLTIGIFSAVPPRLAVLSTYLLGTMFLPQGVLDELPGLPNIDRNVVMSLACMAGVLIFDSRALGRVRFSALDVPMLVWCLCPVATSISNDLGVYDGFSTAFRQTAHWGIPYLLGRAYFMDREGLRMLMIAIVVGTVIYVPLCLWEIRMSPHFHHNLYGTHPRPFKMVHRYGGFRPTVFMQSALMVGMWLSAGIIVAYWGWYSGALRTVRNVPTIWSVPPLLVTLALAKTIGSLSLAVVGLALFPAVRMLRSTLPIMIFMALVALYPALRIQGTLDAAQVLSGAGLLYGEERLESLEVRLFSEDTIVDRAMQRPLLGWGGYGRYIVKDEHGRRTAIPDAIWFIALGQLGLLGLTSIALCFLLPVWLTLRRVRPRSWTSPTYGPLCILSLLVLVWWTDSLLNAMLNPVFLLAMGGVQGFHVTGHRRLRRELQETTDEGSS